MIILHGVTQVGNSLPSDQLEANLHQFFSWGLLGVGGFSNVRIPSSGAYGGNQHQLRLASDPNYQSGQVWEGFRKDWVWETGVLYPTQPIRVSGVYINGGFHPISETGVYSHHINYPLGQVVFDNPISSSSTVSCEFSHRYVQMYTADTPWWQQVQPDSFRVDDSQFLQAGSGAWDILGQNRVQLPAVVIEATTHTSRRPFQIGNLSSTIRQDVLFHIITEERPSMKFLHDAVTRQWQVRLDGFDKDLVFSLDRYPLDEQGSPTASGFMYPQMIAPTGQGGCYWTQIRLMEMRSSEQPRWGNLHYATVRATCEFDLA